MIALFLRATNKLYDVDELRSREALKYDLMKLGFFDQQDCGKYLIWFNRRLKMKEMKEILTAIKFYDLILVPIPNQTRN
ncbi:MAG: hypothetical protein A2562_00190 [Candidatus Nealsonbacteria bacterium RIFOXYD1_FULL_39_11]|nr:MAG: hypothetical protein A2562_00190 [Candidatus Nealsonbacteria bacterium RIFOXYD1_FULL_39_11]